MATARNIITLALESMNRLSPGETLDADLAASCLRRLNSIADDWNSGRDMMFKDAIVTGTATGVSFSTSSGAFASVGFGQAITQVQADGYRMEPITMQQYNAIYLKTQTGRPQFWAWDGADTVYLYPAANGNTLNVLVRAEFSAFADLDASYTIPSGYESAFAAVLAVAMAPALLGKVPIELKEAKREALFNIAGNTARPEIISASPLARRAMGSNILQGWR